MLGDALANYISLFKKTIKQIVFILQFLKEQALEI